MSNKLFIAFDKLLTWLCMFFMSAMTILVILSVFFRYCFNITYVWSEELITIMFISTSLLGCTIAVKQKEHIVVDFIYQVLPPLAAKALRIIISLCNIFMLSILIDAAIDWVGAAGDSPSAGMRLPLYIFYSILPISFGGIILYEVMSIMDNLLNKQGGEIKNEHGNTIS